MIKITISAYPRNLPAFPTEHSFFRCCKYHKPKGNGVINAPIKRYASLNHPIKSHFSTDIKITIFVWFSHGFHGEIAIFLWFSHGFHGEIAIFLWFSYGFHLVPRARCMVRTASRSARRRPRRRPCRATKPGSGDGSANIAGRAWQVPNVVMFMTVHAHRIQPENYQKNKNDDLLTYLKQFWVES